MIAKAKHYPRPVLHYVREELDRKELQRQPQRPLWPSVVTATSCAFVALLCHHIGLRIMPSLWSMLWFVLTFALLPIAGLVVGLIISGD